ncbi:DUF6861 domain-containing protein [Pseudomonas congelans]|uniref:DUF6861 domain-containing protein n=1 Tax=Pseudomonas congelans TaxID=200452 RepID=UPI001864B421|nr:nuclease [Pseudomonas congelans]
MRILADVPMWEDVERTLKDTFDTVNQSFDRGWSSTQDEWNGFTRRVNNNFTSVFGDMNPDRIDAVKEALSLSYPIILTRLSNRWASIEINQIINVLLQVAKEVTMIVGGSVLAGSIVGGAIGALAYGAGIGVGAAVGGGIGFQVGNVILMGLGLSAISDYFYQGLPSCIATLHEGLSVAWNAEYGTPIGLDPTGGSAARRDSRVDEASRLLAKGQEELVTLLLTAIVTYMMRGQIKSSLQGSAEEIMARSSQLQKEISNKQLADWLSKNTEKLIKHPDFQPKDTYRKNNFQDENPEWDTVNSRSDGDFGYLPPLRQNYVKAVYELKKTINRMRANGLDLEDIAKHAYEARTNLKIEYRKFTPPELLETINARNMNKYGNPIGPTFEDLVNKGKTFEQIIDSATRAGGEDIF